MVMLILSASVLRSYYELEAEEYKRKGVDLTPELWLVKLLCGAIDPSYDEQDE